MTNRETRLLSPSAIKERLQQKQIALSEPVSKERLIEFEEIHGIKLPEELIFFYTEVTNGCNMIDGCQLYPFEKWNFDCESIGKPFPFDCFCIWENEDSFDFTKLKCGNIELIDLGCSQSWNIIVNGNQYGKMWNFTDVGISPAVPSLDFQQWFNKWLNGDENSALC